MIASEHIRLDTRAIVSSLRLPPTGLLGEPPELLTITLGNNPRGRPSSTKSPGISPEEVAGDLILLPS